MLKKFLLSLCIILSVPNFSHSEELYDPQNTMLAINMAVVSIQRIINTQDRITLWQEYSNIINNLATGNIESDPEMTALYTGILDFISKRTLRQDEEKLFRERYKKIQKRQFSNSGRNNNVILNFGTNVFVHNSGNETGKKIWDAVKRIFSRYSQRNSESEESDSIISAAGGIVKTCASVLSLFLSENAVDAATGIAGTGKILSFIASCVSGIFDSDVEHHIRPDNMNGTVNLLGGLSDLYSSPYFDYQNHKAELLDGLDDKIWQLRKEDVLDCNELQTRLLHSSWNLVRRYRLPDELKLTEEDIKLFYDAVNKPEAEARMRMLKFIESRFKVYPPYWFHRGQTARALNDRTETAYCFSRFNEVWRPVLRQDPYRAEVEKYIVSELSELLPYDSGGSVRNEIVRHLDILLKHTKQNDWVNYNFAGLGYYASGHKEKAESCIANNIDFNFEREISRTLLDRVRADSIDIASLNRELEDICLKGIISELKDKETGELLACYFRGDSMGLNERMKRIEAPGENIIASEILYLNTRNITASNEYLYVLSSIQNNIENMREKSSEPYVNILPVLKFYLERGNDKANLFAGRMFYYAPGVNRDVYTALSFFIKSDGFYSSYMAGLCLLELGYAQKAEEFFLQSTEGEDFSPALFVLGQLYSTGYYRDKNYDSASQYFQRASLRGYKPAQARLGDLYYEGGNNIKQDYYRAYVWYQVYEFDDGEKRFLSNTWQSIRSNIWFRGDEKPSDRIKLIEGYGLFNSEKLTERERLKARDEAQRIIRKIESQNKFRLVQDNGSSAAKKAAATTVAVGVLMFILKNAF